MPTYSESVENWITKIIDYGDGVIKENVFLYITRR